MSFGTAGTSGTEATLILNLVDEYDNPVSALTLGGKVYIDPHLYDYNNQEIAMD